MIPTLGDLPMRLCVGLMMFMATGITLMLRSNLPIIILAMVDSSAEPTQIGSNSSTPEPLPDV